MLLPLFNSLQLLAMALRIKVHTLSHPVGVAATYLTRLLHELGTCISQPHPYTFQILEHITFLHLKPSEHCSFSLECCSGPPNYQVPSYLFFRMHLNH